MKKRDSYTGPYAHFAKSITLPNDASRVRNEDILSVAKQSEDEFYRTSFAAIDNIPYTPKQSNDPSLR